VQGRNVNDVALDNEQVLDIFGPILVTQDDDPKWVTTIVLVGNNNQIKIGSVISYNDTKFSVVKIVPGRFKRTALEVVRVSS